jgi:FixJ family two-component response regulator
MISLVDDDRGVLEAMAGLLRSLGYSVTTFDSGRALLDWSGLAKSECVIADVMMPGLDGFELQRRLAQKDCRCPVIFLTALAGGDVRESLMRGGAYEVLSKPCSEQSLIDCLEGALKRVRHPN